MRGSQGDAKDLEEQACAFGSWGILGGLEIREKSVSKSRPLPRVHPNAHQKAVVESTSLLSRQQEFQVDSEGHLLRVKCEAKDWAALKIRETNMAFRKVAGVLSPASPAQGPSWPSATPSSCFSQPWLADLSGGGKTRPIPENMGLGHTQGG